MKTIRAKIFSFVCNHTELSRYIIFFIGVALLALLFVITPSESILYFVGIILLLISGSTSLVVAAALDSFISRVQFSEEEKRYKQTTPFYEIDEYNKYISASFADKIMNINHIYDKKCFSDHPKMDEQSNQKAENNKQRKQSSLKKEQNTTSTINKGQNPRIKHIDNSLMQSLGLRRQYLVHRKTKTQLFDEFTKQLIVVAFIKFVYDNTALQFSDDKKNALLISFTIAVITYGAYYFFIRGKKRPNEEYHLLEYEIKKIDSLIMDVDTPNDWDLKKKQQAMNSPRKTKKHRRK